VEFTIAGEALPQLFSHDRLARRGTPSGWSYAQVLQGGESFVALSEGLQNALAACGGVPMELRTDRLSAACRNRNGSFCANITPHYHALCRVAHENGCVVSPHGQLQSSAKSFILTSVMRELSRTIKTRILNKRQPLSHSAQVDSFAAMCR
jgi:hypothetical protein